MKTVDYCALLLCVNAAVAVARNFIIEVEEQLPILDKRSASQVLFAPCLSSLNSSIAISLLILSIRLYKILRMKLRRSSFLRASSWALP